MAQADSEGLLLNLDLGEDILRLKPTYKGGRWRDRVKATKRARHWERRFALPQQQSSQFDDVEEQAVTTQENEHAADQASSRTSKRRRLDDDDEGNATAATQTSTNKLAASTSGALTHKPAKQAANAKPREFISSLFSSNPVSRTVKEAVEEETGPAEPPNAPLPSGTSSFTALGLSTALSSHLLNKLELKAPTSIQKAAIPQLIRDDSDAFIQAETGSGKTLAYLLPILQRIMHSSNGSATTKKKKKKKKEAAGKIHRDSGLFAIILAPTRELCRQISTVLETLLRCAHWIVAGAVIGGEKKKSEKARMRKGLNILVATPGRLADHLDNTEVLDVSKVRWLVLDEGDRLTELGFEEQIKGIVTKLQERSSISESKPEDPTGLPRRRVTILCSATMKMDVQRLGEISLQDAVYLKADPVKGDGLVTDAGDHEPKKDVFSAPAQLKQSFAVVSAKLRLVTLTAVLRRAFVRRGSVMKAIVFLSCADSVDYHFEVFTRLSNDDDSGKEKEKQTEQQPSTDNLVRGTVAQAATLSSKDNMVTLYKLHGSLQQQVRTATLAAYSRSKDPSIMICTDVASRGLDLPNVDLVVEYDPPFSKDDHLHRIGRTARAGRGGRTLIFLLPGSEEGYIDVLKEARHEGAKGLVREDADELLRKGLGSLGIGAGKDWEHRATQWQLEVERWVLEDSTRLEMARRAYQSHIRAYATHVAAERSFFDIKALHLGHLAKAFALRDKPGNINVPGLRGSKEGGRGKRTGNSKEHRPTRASEKSEIVTIDEADAARKMRKKMQEHMGGISEFNVG
ncbi:MAG: ATP-dependent RNA helicase dbp7 [Peltula sp. TS41687]|nr:MAG: ATP-dependent RNA helicase dbp7 [Peltula sp. TS41687]